MMTEVVKRNPYVCYVCDISKIGIYDMNALFRYCIDVVFYYN